jgi:hypothetical protein
VWPSLLVECFGVACLDTMEADALAEFDSDDCLRIAYKLRLPIWVDNFLPLPVCLEAWNPLAGAESRKLRIQTIHQDSHKEGEMIAFTEEDGPLDEDFGAPLFAIYGVQSDDCLEQIADRASYQEARNLLVDLLPGMDLPTRVFAFVRPPSSLGAATCS